MGNLRSVAQALRHAAPEADVRISADGNEILAADRVVLPGQGAMPDCMRNLRESGLQEVVLRCAASKPLLGVCVGEQMLCDHSDEGNTPGLGLFAGNCVRFAEADMRLPEGARLKVPHMGWNRVTGRDRFVDDHEPFVYFVHSYHAVPEDRSIVALEATHGAPFCAAIRKDNLLACQFHPEKSQRVGLAILKNFVERA